MSGDWHREQGYAAIQLNAVVEERAGRAAVAEPRVRVVGTVPGAFDSRAHGRVGLHVMHLQLR